MRLMPTRRIALASFLLALHLVLASAAVGQSRPLFPGPIGYDVGSSPTSVASGDLDGDGWSDLVVACFPNSLSVLLGNSEGLFGTAKQYAIGPPPTFAGGGPRAAVLGDVNGDAILDVAVADSADEAIYIFNGKPGGGFQAPVPHACPEEPTVVELADLTGDGALDLLVIANLYSLIVFPSSGGGSFGTPIVLEPPWSVVDVAAGDFNQDGLMDVAIVRYPEYTVAVRFGIGGGALGLATDVATVVGFIQAIELGDLDVDGNLDIVVAVRDGTAAGSVQVLFGRGGGLFAPPSSHDVGPSPSALSLVDVNDDSHPDVAVVDSQANTLSVLLGLGGGHLSPPSSCGAGPEPFAMCATDPNGDGRPELAVANSVWGTVSVYDGNDRGVFQAATTLAVGDDPQAVLAADLSGDGHVDLVSANDGSVTVLLGNGQGSFLPWATYPTGSYPEALASGDVDQDGLLDVVVAFETSNRVGVLLGTGGGGLAPPASYGVGAQPVAVAVGRVDEDSLLDIVAANSGADTVSVLLGQPGGGFVPHTDFFVGSEPRSVALGDVDGDGRLDLATAHQDLGKVSVLLNQGAGSFGEKKSYWVGSPDFVTFADLNSDQDLDIVAVRDVHSIGVLLGQAGGSFGAVKPYHVATVPQQIATGDIDGDGFTDVAVSCLLGGSVSVLLGDGSGALEPATNFAIPNTCWGLELADVNEDGRLDVATAALWAESYVSLLLNSGGASIGSWTDIGYGLDGAAGSPVLSGQGSLVSSAPGVLMLASAASAAPGMLFVSMVSAPTDFKCGTLVPLPPLVRLAFATDSNGVASWSWLEWPASLAGVDLYMQAVVADPAAVCGVALSNALWVVVP